MGYLYRYAWKTKSQAANEILSYYKTASEDVRVEYVDHSLVGSELFILYRDKETGLVSGDCHLLRLSDGCVGNKAIGFSSHPYYYNCPERLLKQVTDPNAAEYVETSRKAAIHKKERSAYVRGLRDGDVVSHGNGSKVIFRRPYSKTYFVGESAHGSLFRYRIENINIPTTEVAAHV